jgi:DNA-binding beta-propeller fold protein YncE
MAKLKNGTRVYGDLLVDGAVDFTAVTLASPVLGELEYDGSFFYSTPSATSGRASIPPVYTFRRTTNGAAIGSAIADFFTTPSSLSLEASSAYRISCFAYFTKTTAGTATWTQLFSNAPTIVDGVHYVTPVTGMTAATSATYTQIQQYFYEQGSATFAWNPSATNLTTGVNHFYRLDMTVVTNAATNWRLRLTQGAGTATPLAGSFYTVRQISTSTGTFAA